MKDKNVLSNKSKLRLIVFPLFGTLRKQHALPTTETRRRKHYCSCAAPYKKEISF